MNTTSRGPVGMHLLVAALAALGLLPPATAHAVDVVQGEAQFSGTVFVSKFPCPLTETCMGTVQGSVNGEAAGVKDGVPWITTIPNAAVTANFAVNEVCNPVEVPIPLVGTAGGTGTFTVSLGGSAIGTYGPETTPGFVLPIVAVHLDFSFFWTRVSLVAHITFSDTLSIQIRRPGNILEWIEVATGEEARGLAVFAPTTIPPPSCESPGPLTGFIAGTHTVI